MIEKYFEYRGEPSVFSSFPTKALVGTKNGEGTITDSAAGGTALACGVKTRNGAIGLDISGKRVTSLAEIAHCKGMKVGIITNVTLNDATPASFYAHQSSRRAYYDIALEMVESDFDLFVGWGIASPTGEGKRPNVLGLAKEKGYHVIQGWHDFMGTSVLPLLALVPFPFALDRPPDMPSLPHAVRRGIELLEGTQGFFLVVEGGKIDWCKHMNDAGSLLRELEDFAQAVHEAIRFAKRYPEETVIVVTADHETGGFGIEDEIAFEVLEEQTFSYQTFLNRVAKGEDPFSLLWELWGFTRGEMSALVSPVEDPQRMFIALAQEYARRVGVTWQTTHHTAEKVPVFLWNGEEFRGKENVDIFAFFRTLLEGDTPL